MTGSHRRATTIAAVAVLAAGALTGCKPFSDDSKPSAATTTKSTGVAVPDVCVLFTKEDAGALLRKPVSVAKPNSKGDEKGCDYDSSILLTLSPTTEAEFEDGQVNYPKVPNVGDDAYTKSGVLWVRHGTTEINVIAPGDELRAAIARKLIERLDAVGGAPSPSSS